MKILLTNVVSEEFQHNWFLFSAYVLILDVECCCKLPLLELFDVIHSEIVFLGQIKRLMPKNMCQKFWLTNNAHYKAM